MNKNRSLQILAVIVVLAERKQRGMKSFVFHVEHLLRRIKLQTVGNRSWSAPPAMHPFYPVKNSAGNVEQKSK